MLTAAAKPCRLPTAFRLEGDTLYIRRDENGGVVLSAHSADWQGFIDTLPYTEQDTAHYGQFKAAAEQRGRSLLALDMLIAACVNGLILVSHDGAFGKIDGLAVEDWAT